MLKIVILEKIFIRMIIRFIYIILKFSFNLITFDYFGFMNAIFV